MFTSTHGAPARNAGPVSSDRSAASESKPDPNRCPFCGRNCRVALARSMPAVVVQAFESARVYVLATCEEGAAADHAKYGASYADVIVARVGLAAATQDAASRWEPAAPVFRAVSG